MVLVFIEPQFLSGLSLNTLALECTDAHIILAPLISDNEDWIRGTLTLPYAWVSETTVRATVGKSLVTYVGGASIIIIMH